MYRLQQNRTPTVKCLIKRSFLRIRASSHEIVQYVTLRAALKVESERHERKIGLTRVASYKSGAHTGLTMGHASDGYDRLTAPEHESSTERRMNVEMCLCNAHRISTIELFGGRMGPCQASSCSTFS